VSDARTPGTRLIDTWNDLSQCITDGATDKWRKTWGHVWMKKEAVLNTFCKITYKGSRAHWFREQTRYF